MIEIRDLTKVYQTPGGLEVRALNKVNLTVEKGEFLAIMGASGSGKSTLLHMIGCVDTPTSGTVEIDHENIHTMKPSELARFRRRKVGIIYQAYNLIPTLTVEENMILPLLLDKRTPSRETVEKLLELLGLKDRRNHFGTACGTPCGRAYRKPRQRKFRGNNELLSKNKQGGTDDPYGHT
jgi:putative ABC transport system ATP-binding protein